MNAYAALSRTISPIVARLSETVLSAETLTRLRTTRHWRRWVDSLTPEHFEDLSNASVDRKRDLFKASVNRVEIECHARCNRICAFCPNVIVDRRQNYTQTDAQMLDRVFDELGSIDYSAQITVARYSEPLANETALFRTISSARKRVPNAQLAITTNTDYLKRKTLDRLRDLGLNVVYMSIYLRNREKWSPELATEYSERLAEKLRVKIAQRHQTAESLRCDYDYDGLHLLSNCINFGQTGDDRGAVLEQYMHTERIGPCLEPFETFVIDHSGAVMPCCNLRSDIPEHQATIVGDLLTEGSSIFDIYAGRLSGWRRSMAAFGEKDWPCRTCTHRDIPEDIAKQVSAHLDRRRSELALRP
jgi:MoaA/NifB/PqqE/SkfB family radical SAM enzyme